MDKDDKEIKDENILLISCLRMAWTELCVTGWFSSNVYEDGTMC
jgi:hypothetical protein